VIVEVHAQNSIANSSKPFARSCDFHEESHGLRCFSPSTGLIASEAMLAHSSQCLACSYSQYWRGLPDQL